MTMNLNAHQLSQLGSIMIMKNDKPNKKNNNMKPKKLPAITHSWSVSGTVPNPEQKYPNHGQNVHIGVQADSMEKALEAVRGVYPKIEIFGCHHRGEVNIQSIT